MSKTESRFVDFRAVKAAVTMEQVLNHYGLSDRFKRGRDSLSGPCPIHQGTNPTQFRVCISKNCWNCFSECKCGGNVLDFVAKMENVEPMEAANRLVEWFGLDRAQLNVAYDQNRPSDRQSRDQRPASSNGAAVNEALPPPLVPSPAKPNAQPSRPAKEETGTNKPLGFRLELDPSHPYLAERGLSPETIDEFGVGFCGKGVMAQRIAIPIHAAVKGELVGYAGRWPGNPPDGRPKYRLPDGFKKSVEVYRLAEALREPSEQPLVIVEGFFDAMKLWQLGVRKCVALMGSSLSGAQEALLAQHLRPASQVIVMFDEDHAGREGREDVLRRLAFKAFVRVVASTEEGFQPEQLTPTVAQSLHLI
ncbi:MAG: toprim domain-containing protein [Verrucomicrobia bacterium]|nr:toprim domain-containing protein [Verrucomicrobiota bacterium]